MVHRTGRVNDLDATFHYRAGEQAKVAARRAAQISVAGELHPQSSSKRYEPDWEILLSATALDQAVGLIGFMTYETMIP